MKVDHIARAQKAWPILVRVARKRKRISYGELCAQLGLHQRAAAYFLGVIQHYCKSQRLQPLQAVAVNKRTRVPGIGYVASARGGNAYLATLDKVYSESWPIRAPKFHT